MSGIIHYQPTKAHHAVDGIIHFRITVPARCPRKSINIDLLPVIFLISRINHKLQLLCLGEMQVLISVISNKTNIIAPRCQHIGLHGEVSFHLVNHGISLLNSMHRESSDPNIDRLTPGINTFSGIH